MVLLFKKDETTIGEMQDTVVAAHPALKPVIESGVSVAVDGEVVTAGNHPEIGPENEIFLLQRRKGG